MRINIIYISVQGKSIGNIQNYEALDWFLFFNATFSNISAISWRPALVVEEAGENHRPWASNW